MKIKVPARLQSGQDRIRNPFSFLLFHYFFYLVSNSTHCYDFKIRLSLKTLCDSSYILPPIYRMWVCLVSYHTSSINCFVNVLPGRSCRLHIKTGILLGQNKTFLISCNRHFHHKSNSVEPITILCSFEYPPVHVEAVLRLSKNHFIPFFRFLPYNRHFPKRNPRRISSKEPFAVIISTGIDILLNELRHQFIAIHNRHHNIEK